MLEGQTLLIVEDEPIIAFSLEDLLISLGCREVHLATHIDKAIHLLLETPVDAAVLDVNIHGHRSYPVALELKKRAVPFIFATGYGDAEHPAEFALVPTVTKPYVPSAIVEALEQARGRSRVM